MLSFHLYVKTKSRPQKRQPPFYTGGVAQSPQKLQTIQQGKPDRVLKENLFYGGVAQVVRRQRRRNSLSGQGWEKKRLSHLAT